VANRARVLPARSAVAGLKGAGSIGYSRGLGAYGIPRMRPSIALQRHRHAIRQIIERHHGKNARVFGSVLHGQDTDESDLDILIDTTEETSLFDIGAMQVELTELLGVKVDVLTPGALPARWKMRVLNEARAV
jgi:uncharacterized protein